MGRIASFLKSFAAGKVTLTDAGNYYNTDTVEAALQVLGAYISARPLPPVPTLSAPATAAGAEGSFATYTVTFSSATGGTATATVTLTHVTTVAADITSLDVKIAGVWTPITSGDTITLPAGAVDLPVRIVFAEDAAIEGDETFTVAVAGVTGITGSGTTTVTVTDNGVGGVPVLAFVGSLLESTGDLVITLPSLAVGDLVIVLVQTANQVPATPSGWVASPGVGSGTAGAAGAFRMSNFRKQVTVANTPASVTFVDPGNHMCAVVLKITGGATAIDPYVHFSNYVSAAASEHWVGYGAATIPKNALVVYANAHGISTAAPQFDTYTPSSVLSSFSEVFDSGSTLGVGGGFAVAKGSFLAGGELTTTSFTMQSSTAISVMIFAIGPAQPIVPPAPNTSGEMIKQAVINGMQAPNDGVQLGYQRAQYAGVQMGLVARGTNTPTYWNGPAQYKDADPWTGISPWWNLLPLQGNAANTASLEIGTMMLLTRAKGTNNYSVLYKGKSGWAARYNSNAQFYISTINGTPGTVPGYTSVVYPLIAQPSSDTMHGGGGFQGIDATQIDNLIVIMAARLTGPDVGLAQWALWAGVDWYPFVGYNVQANPPSYVPAVCTGRLNRITGDWKLFATAPLDNPGRGLDAPNYTYGTVGVYSSDAQFKANTVPNIDGLLPP